MHVNRRRHRRHAAGNSRGTQPSGQGGRKAGQAKGLRDAKRNHPALGMWRP